jgi:hypothetical protein
MLSTRFHLLPTPFHFVHAGFWALSRFCFFGVLWVEFTEMRAPRRQTNVERRAKEGVHRSELLLVVEDSRGDTHTVLRLWLLIVLGAVGARASVPCCRSVAGFGRPCEDSSAAVLSEACQQEYTDTSRFRACGAWGETTVPTGNTALFVGPTSPSRSSSWRAFAAGR